MLGTHTGAAARAWIAAGIVCCLGLAWAPMASAHDAANCAAFLHEDGASYANSCTFPFQGYPIGMAAKYEPNALDPVTRPSSIHAEVTLHPAFGPDQSLSMECYDPAPDPDTGIQPAKYGTTKCLQEYNSPQTDQQFTLVEPIPTEIVSMTCAAHSHALYSRNYAPGGEFACWSTVEARQDLEDDGILGEIGY